jgi:truncated hemoglobin YjbI
MAEKGTLSRLVSGLTLEERRSLLEKLSGVSTFSQEPLYEPSSEDGAPSLETRYARLPWYSRFWLRILSIFIARPPLKIFEDRQAAALGRDIETRWPGFFDYRRGLLLPAFYAAVSELKEGARFFYTALDSSVNQDRGAFYSFLGSLEMGDIHSRLLEETDPEKIIKGNPQLQDPELRQEALRALDEILAGISDDDRRAMYANVRALHHLKELSSFLFDRVIMAFGFDQNFSGQTCSIRVVRGMLSNLNNILYSLEAPPSLALLESMFVFILQEREGEGEFDLETELRGLLNQAEASLLVVRRFNRQVPLTRILRCAGRNLTFMPEPLTGGEDWFALYQDYWKKHTESRLGEYLRSRRRRELIEVLEDFFGGADLAVLAAAVSETNPGGFPLKGALALSFLRSFRKELFLGDLSRILKPLYTAGNFVKRENRNEFSKLYESLQNQEAEIAALEETISAEGDLGRRYAHIQGDMSSLPAKRRKTQIILDEAAEGAARIAAAARTAFKAMADLLKGITGEESGGKYGPLSNLDKLGGKGIPLTDLLGAVDQFQRALKILDEIDLMEAG